jgi:RNA polymerase sigma-70 factor (ECF subfamily)
MSIEDIAKAITGDQEAFKRVYKEYHPIIARKVKCYCRTVSDIDDRCQEVWAKAIDHWSRTGEVPTNPKAWFYTVALNVCLDWLKRKRISEGLQRGLKYAFEEITKGKNQEDNWIDTEYLKQVILNQLDEVETQVIIMKYWVDKTYEEIADDLNLTRDQVKYILQRAWNKIKTCLKE